MLIQAPDISQLLEFEKSSWPEGLRANPATLMKRLLDFKEGIFMWEDRHLVCQVTVAPKKIREIKSFTQMRDLPVDLGSKNLWITNIATHRNFRGRGYATLLFKEVIDWATGHYETIQTGVTCSGLKDSGLRPEEYMEKGMNPALNLFGTKDYKIIPNYWEEDDGSMGYGVLVKKTL